MATQRIRALLFLSAAVLTACASAEDRLNEGISLQSQGRYIQAVYRYADALEKDRALTAARDRMLAAGDTAVMIAMDDADALERRGDPVEAAAQYVRIDQMLARIREVGERPRLPGDYSVIRRAIFDTAIDWQMARGDEATEEGRWSDARAFYVNARGSYLPSREQVEESYDAETRLLLRWAEVELQDRHPRMAYERAEEALSVRTSPARETVLAVREIQDRALAEGTIVVAVAPVMADPAVRDWLGGEFEVELDQDLSLDHWTQPPLFVQMADPLLLRSELRGLLRGQALQSPLLVGRALQLIGADLGVMVRIASIEVVEEDVDRDRHQAMVQLNRRTTGWYPGFSNALAEDGTQMASGGQGPGGEGNEGRGPPEEGNNGRGPDCEPGNRGRGPQDTGNNGRGPGDNGRRCPGEPTDSSTTGGTTTGGTTTGGTSTGGTTTGGSAGGGTTSGGDSGGTTSGGTVRGDGTTRPSDGTVDRRGTPLGGSATPADTVTYYTVRGTMVYEVVAEIILVDPEGREVNRFTASSLQRGTFERGEFDGDPRVLMLEPSHERFFDPAVFADQMAAIEQAVLEELAVTIATGTFDQILSGIP